MKFVGVDPGASGAICVLSESEGVVRVDALIRLNQTEQDVCRGLEVGIDPSSDYTAVIERVSAMPKQGVASSFKFGQSYGFLRGLLTAYMIPFEDVSPAKWQGEMKCRTKGDKNVTKQMAGQLFPSVKVAHWNADALLLAEWCRRTWNMRAGR